MFQNLLGCAARRCGGKLAPAMAICLAAGSVSAQTTHTPANSAAFVTALTNAQPGDTIILDAATTYTGAFVLPVKTGSEYITIQSSALASLPPEGTRVTLANAANMPNVVSSGANAPVIKAAQGAHHYKLIGLEFVAPADNSYINQLIQTGTSGVAQDTLQEVPYNIIINRCIVRANTPAQILRRGIALNSASSDVTDSYITDVKNVGGDDSQGICAWNSPGPINIINNFIEASCENVMIGGAVPTVPNLVPSNVVIERNHLFKRAGWNQHDTTNYEGNNYSIKNIFEVKNGSGILLEGNILENHWVDAQPGWCIVLTPATEPGLASWTVVEDVTFRSNIIRHIAAGPNMNERDVDGDASQQTNRITFENNLFYDIGGSAWGGNGKFMQMLGAIDQVRLDHDTVFQPSTTLTIGGSGMNTNCVFTDNIFAHGPYGFKASPNPGGATFDARFTNLVFQKNVMMDNSSYSLNQLLNFYYSPYQGGWSPTSLAFPQSWTGVVVNQADSTPETTNYASYKVVAGSAYDNAATDGSDVGADIDALVAATAGCISGTWNALLNDTFESANATIGDDANDPDDTAWYRRMSSSQPTLSVVSDATFGSNVMHVDTTGKGQPVLASFPAKTLTNVGDKITLTVGVRVVGSTAGAGLRFGLFDDGGTPVTGDNQSASDNDKGYYVNIGTPTSGLGASALQKESDGSGKIFETFTTLGSTVSSAFTPDQAVHNVALVIEKTGASQLTITGTWTGATNGGSIVRTDGGSLVTTFNAIAFSFGNGSGTPTIDYRVDNINVQ